MLRTVAALALMAAGAFAANVALAQSRAPHDPSMHHRAASPAATVPTLPGQDAFGAIAEVVRLLEADPATDWSRVDLERLRQHLIDMNRVVLDADVKQTPIPGGLVMEITGTGRTERSIRAMVPAHATELDRMPQWTARAEAMPGGIRLTVVARDAADASTVARIRALGFAGLLTEGAHHAPHHLAIAQGAGPAHAR